MEFADFFRKATTHGPHPYQARLAEAQRLPVLLVAATGTGKTEAAILSAWLWRRLHHPEEAVRSAMPLRLIYCLPMRTLVEQTHARVSKWLANLGLSDRIHTTVLMGGEEQDEWYLYPEQERIIIGTQDMLLSRALNRGYASSPFRWPWEFGLMNSDCLWVLDEVQLMANGLPTSTQLQAFRRSLGSYGTCHSLWMSATAHPEWMHTVDFPSPSDEDVFTLGQDDYRDLDACLHAPKTLQKVDIAGKGSVYDVKQAARKVLELHQPGSMTLVVVNTVGRSQAFHDELRKLKPQSEIVLVHSRFRPPERQVKNERVTAPVEGGSAGRIVVATQAIEAGVDISARTLVTELAPWTSLVQRFGRCNRKGEYTDAAVYWLDVPNKDDKEAAPYGAEELHVARERLQGLESGSVAPADLPEFQDSIAHGTVLRRRDIVGLFDTTADLSGSYLDVSRFVRGNDETDVYVFWRSWKSGEELASLAAPTRDELCSVPIGDIKGFLGAGRKVRGPSRAGEEDPLEMPEDADEEATAAIGGQRRQAWRWDHLAGHWEQIGAWHVYPGQTLLLQASHGGYTPEKGWSSASPVHVPEIPRSQVVPTPDCMGDESTNTGQKKWVSLSKHSQHVLDESHHLLNALANLNVPTKIQEAVTTAAQYHDLGKAHPTFQRFLLSRLEPQEVPLPSGTVWAKRGSIKRPDFEGRRPHFRHELGSAIALLSAPTPLEGWATDLAAYLVASHHGKVRLGLRSFPKARDQSPDHYYLLGFRVPSDSTTQDDLKQDNTLPATDLGEGAATPELLLDLSLARVGVSANGERSWLNRTLDLLDRFGPFRLAYLEALVRAADVRASKAEQLSGGDHNG